MSLVSDLITDYGQWNEGLIHDTLLLIDAEAILRIPIRQNDEDWWA